MTVYGLNAVKSTIMPNNRRRPLREPLQADDSARKLDAFGDNTRAADTSLVDVAMQLESSHAQSPRVLLKCGRLVR